MAKLRSENSKNGAAEILKKENNKNDAIRNPI
jgi:hypothetical protein